ncbi:MAG TPA: hypothetical protein VFZ22_02245 [Pyrinomonadaceae bacterium]|nr:hypothetical protein [Pyrinomonadaceae bacterium]
MKPKHAHLLIIAIALLTCAPTGAATQPQTVTSLTANAKGEGTVTIADPQSPDSARTHKVNSVVVTLRENGDADIVLVSDMQLFARGRWTKPSDLSKGIDLKITGGIVAGNAKGTGKLFLRPDGKSIDRLNFEVTGSARSKVTVAFVAEKQATPSAQ